MISLDSVRMLVRNGISYLKIIYKTDVIDSIFFFSLNKTGQEVIKIKKHNIDTVSVYYFSYPSAPSGKVSKYLSYSRSHIVSYFFYSPIIYPDNSIECTVTDIKMNESISSNYRFLQKDTVNFIYSLLHNRLVPLNKDSKSIIRNNWNDKTLTLLKLYNRK